MTVNPKLVFNPPPGDGPFEEARFDWLDAVAHELNIEHTRWSVISPDVNDFNIVPFPMAHAVFYGGGAWGKPQLKTFSHPLRWGEIWKVCDELVGKGGDLDHVFIETVECDSEDTITFFCGS